MTKKSQLTRTGVTTRAAAYVEPPTSVTKDTTPGRKRSNPTRDEGPAIKHPRGNRLTKNDIPKIIKKVLEAFNESDTESDDELETPMTEEIQEEMQEQGDSTVGMQSVVYATHTARLARARPRILIVCSAHFTVPAHAF